MIPAESRNCRKLFFFQCGLSWFKPQDRVNLTVTATALVLQLQGDAEVSPTLYCLFTSDYPIPEMSTVMDSPDFITPGIRGSIKVIEIFMALFFHRNTLSKAPKVPFQCTLPSRLSCSLAVGLVELCPRHPP